MSREDRKEDGKEKAIPTSTLNSKPYASQHRISHLRSITLRTRATKNDPRYPSCIRTQHSQRTVIERAINRCRERGLDVDLLAAEFIVVVVVYEGFGANGRYVGECYEGDERDKKEDSSFPALEETSRCRYHTYFAPWL